MVYMLAVNKRPYDEVDLTTVPDEPVGFAFTYRDEPMPERIEHVRKLYRGDLRIRVMLDDCHHKRKPIPSIVMTTNKCYFGGVGAMPDVFTIGGTYIFGSSRFKAIVDQFTEAVEFAQIDVEIPPGKKPADAYYFINVLGRGQLLNWQAMLGDKVSGVFTQPPSGANAWIMRPPPKDHPKIWEETEVKTTATTYSPIHGKIFVTDQLGDALLAALPGQFSLWHIREVDGP